MTAYEMRISDSSSDVCSSDLILAPYFDDAREAAAQHSHQRSPWHERQYEAARDRQQRRRTVPDAERDVARDTGAKAARRRAFPAGRRDPRSEEQTSELQSLMRISYAVFCLKKKTPTQQHNLIQIQSRDTHK